MSDYDNIEDDLIPEDIDVFSVNDTKILKLTRNESLFIDDSLTMIIEREHGDERITTVRPLQHTAALPSPVDLLEKIAIAILYTTDPKNEGKEAELFVSDTDLYMLREISHSYIKVGEEPVGFNLKRKIYTLLYQKRYERDQVARQIIAQIDSVLPMDTIKDNVRNHREDLKNKKEK